MLIWILAKKDMRRLLRDPRAMVILLAMPIIFVLVLGLSLGETFGQKPDDRLRVSVVDDDLGFTPRFEAALAVAPHGAFPATVPWAALYLNCQHQPPPSPFGTKTWSQVVIQDLAQTADIRVEIIPSRAEAQRLTHESRRAAVLVFGPHFSQQVSRTSFLVDGINPFFRDGVSFAEVDVHLITDDTQRTAAGIIEQVGQVTLLRVILPWMIGRAFEKLGDPHFMTLFSEKVAAKHKEGRAKLSFTDQAQLVAALSPPVKKILASSVQEALQTLFPKYDLTGKTWEKLTKAKPEVREGAEVTRWAEHSSGLLKRGALRYQILVPSYIVMFAFFMVLTVGWLFVAERHQGTLKRLRAAPLSRTEIVLGKLLPCFGLSLFQGLFLLAAGKVVFGMDWGTHPWWLLLVVFTTSLAAMGMALFVAALARTETQVAIYGTLLVLVLAGISGCLMGDRDLMPEAMKNFSLATPHAWALSAYKQLLTSQVPNLSMVGESCGVLSLFGVGFLSLAWTFLKLD